MNENTRIIVHAYSGDAHQVEAFLPQYQHHGCPVTVLSPADAPVRIDGMDCRSAGGRGYFGQGSLDRQRAHLKLLLSYPEKFFLLNDADSFCLSPEIPRYLYENAEGTLWSTEVKEPRPHSSPYPKLGLHPPYFLTRETIKRLLAVGPVKAHPITPFIDHLMLQLACEAGIAHCSYPDGRSFPAWRHGSIPETKLLGHDFIHRQEAQGIDGAKRMADMVRSAGVVFVHSVKHPEVRDQLVQAFARRRSRVLRVPKPQVPSRPARDGDVSVLVAFRDDTADKHRTSLWETVQGLLRADLPEMEIVVGTDDGLPFAKTKALNRAAARASGSVFYILDADSWVPADQVREAHRLIASGKAWAKPWSVKYKLGAAATEEALSDGWDGTYRREWARGLEFRGPYAPAPPLLVTREAFDQVGGLDPRMKGWGQEDVCFSLALGAIVGPAGLVRGDCVHLHHARIGRSGADLWPGQDSAMENRLLAQEYHKARRSKEQMLAVIAARQEVLT